MTSRSRCADQGFVRAATCGSRPDAGRRPRRDPAGRVPVGFRTGTGKGRGCDGQVSPVAQHQHGPLPGGQLRSAQRNSARSSTCRRARAALWSAASAPSPGGAELGPLPGPAAGVMQHQVDQDPAGISGGVIHGSHPVPPPRYPQQRFLGQVLGVPAIPRHQ